MSHHHLAGLGIGPFNLGLAALCSRHAEISTIFFDRKPEFRWHEGLILPGTTLQVPFLADLVTLVDPGHPLSFLSYLAAHDRLYNFYFYENFFIPREEYDHYCRWASRQLASCRFGEDIVGLGYDDETSRFQIESVTRDGKTSVYRADHIAIGVGTVPALPRWARIRPGVALLHASEFGKRRHELSGKQSIVVIGSGQSAAECVLALYGDLTPQQVAGGMSIHWVTRSPGFFPMEYSKLGLEHFTPDYMDLFHQLGPERRRDIVAGQGLLHKGISFSTIGAIFDLLYQRSVGRRNPGLFLHSHCEVVNVEAGAQAGFRIDLRHGLLEQTATIQTDAIVAATGYRHQWPTWLDALKGGVLATDDQGDLVIDETFQARRADGRPGSIFVQNAETFHHGVGSPDLGLGAYRNGVILNQVLGRCHYRRPARTAFQSFGLPAAAVVTSPTADCAQGDRYASL